MIKRLSPKSRLSLAAGACGVLGLLAMAPIGRFWLPGFVAGLLLLAAAYFIWKRSFLVLAAAVSLVALVGVFSALNGKPLGVLIIAVFVLAMAQALVVLWSGDQVKLLMMMLAVNAILVAAVTKLAAGGWGVIIFAVPYAGIFLGHLLIHRRAWRAYHATRWILGVAIASDVLLIAGFLLQLDQGDNDYPWLTITALTSGGPGYPASDAPSWWPTNSTYMNILVLIPVVLSWVPLWKLSKPDQ